MIDIRLENGACVLAEVCAVDLLPKLIKTSDNGDYWIVESMRTGTVIHVLDPEKSIVEVLKFERID
ncbi:hypothetical protein J2Z60_001807 [Lactobacillus colini]|uniref:Uncharacterized protein n=1 Tax=Lactobacillus colini TaxID=1819254 RepID=A0ABS4MG04_9LACO|nr:hypothetical protein [Lactobacillus colini]MBP2058619.1 hypothetical protein [Lactobacillus colini]